MLESVKTAQDTQDIARPFRLLIIDDDSIDRQSYLRFLAGDKTSSYIVIEASSALEGARLLAEGPYDCVVLDYRLPGTDGLSLLQSFRESTGPTPPSPVVMMTGQGNESIAVEAMKRGIADYLV